ncbi:MAG: PilW family protein [Candidatus Babeliales bacterium]
MKNSPGFLLIELLVYIAASLFLAVVVLRSAISYTQQLTTTRNAVQKTSSMQSALVAFKRDIEQAPCACDAWYVINDHELIWRGDHDACGWSYEKKSLIRRQGTYDHKKKNWGKKTKSVAAQGLEHVIFSVHKSDTAIQEVDCMLSAHKEGTKKSFTMNVQVPLCNGEILV